MTDKQIINGIDVSGCDFLAKEDDYCSYSGEYRAYKGQCGCSDEGMCKDHPNCFYKKALKQLKRKEQEYKELRQYHNKCCKEFENEKQELLEKYNQISRGFYNGDYCNTKHCSLLQAKEQECEKLKRQYKELGQCSKKLKDYYDKEKETLSNRFLELKQILTKIKEIAEGMHDLWINKTPYTDMDNLVKHLLECELNRIRYKLDEISECEVNNDKAR